jgi:NADP-dependent 3-hydroxy acid dehydrogenase YdfG
LPDRRFPQQKQPAPGSAEQLEPKAEYGEETYIGHGKLQGRAALITGADSGIGRAVALCFAKEGAEILFTHLPEEQNDAEETIRLIESAGGSVVAIPGDIRQKSFCEKLVDETVRQYGRIDILVNNAAFQRTHEKLQDISEEEFDTTSEPTSMPPSSLPRRRSPA